MYSFQSHSNQSALTSERIRKESRVQILGPDDQHFDRSLLNIDGFWASKRSLAHGHNCDEENERSADMGESYRLTATLHQGCLYESKSRQWLRWCYSILPVYGWGHPSKRQQSTAGWFSHFQMFEPGWQVLMAHGWATGWFEWVADSEPRPLARRFEFQRVPAYAEKNWGGAFPKKWFWIQCNCFENHPDLTLTAGGGIRGLMHWQESLGMVGIHFRGTFFEFVPWNGRISWQIEPWGSWCLWGEKGPYRVELTGKTSEPGVQVMVPTESGLQYNCRDTTRGELSVNLWRRSGCSSQLIVSAFSRQAGLEVGGTGWTCRWQGNSQDRKETT
jgi:tocopherol cyclase